MLASLQFPISSSRPLIFYAATSFWAGLYVLHHSQSLTEFSLTLVNHLKLFLGHHSSASGPLPVAVLASLACLPFFERCSGLPSPFPLFPLLVCHPSPSLHVQTSFLNSYIIFSDCSEPIPLTTPNPPFPVPHNLPPPPSVIIPCPSAAPGA